MVDRPTIMLVHGAWHGSWCWDAVRGALHQQGFATAAVDNPSVTVPGSDLAADGDNLRRALDAVDRAAAASAPGHTAWMPRSCRSTCMVAASTSYEAHAGPVPAATAAR